MPAVPVLLDTNFLVHLIRHDAIGRALKRDRGLLLADPPPAICSVSEGEIRSLAHQFQWTQEKLDKMGFLLDHFARVSIENPETMESYAVIDSYSRARGIRMGKNDVWIAAAAHVTAFPLLTTDLDFDHLHGVVLTRTLVEG